MFSVGDKVVYPMHGAGTIASIEKREVAGELVDYFVLDMLLTRMKVMVPVANVERVGLRSIGKKDSLRQVEKVLQDRPENTMKSITWNRRYNLYLEKMKSGDILQAADVVRTLTVQDAGKKLSTGERKLLNTAKQILLSEVMLIRSYTLEKSESWLAKFFE